MAITGPIAGPITVAITGAGKADSTSPGGRELRRGIHLERRAAEAARIHYDYAAGFAIKREFKSIADMAEDIHFRNSLEVGYTMGKQIAAYLIDNSLKAQRVDGNRAVDSQRAAESGTSVKSIPGSCG
jgi:hypothetical protein